MPINLCLCFRSKHDVKGRAAYVFFDSKLQVLQVAAPEVKPKDVDTNFNDERI